MLRSMKRRTVQVALVLVSWSSSTVSAQGVSSTLDPGVLAGQGACRSLTRPSGGMECHLPATRGATVQLGAEPHDRWVTVHAGTVLLTLDGHAVTLGAGRKAHIPAGQRLSFGGLGEAATVRVTQSPPVSDAPRDGGSLRTA